MENGIRKTEYGIQNTEYGIRNTEYRIQKTEYRIMDYGYGITETRIYSAMNPWHVVFPEAVIHLSTSPDRPGRLKIESEVPVGTLAHL